MGLGRRVHRRRERSFGHVLQPGRHHERWVASSFWAASARSCSPGRRSRTALIRRTWTRRFQVDRHHDDCRSFIGTVVKFGRKRFGDHQFALAYSTFEVDRNPLARARFRARTRASSLDLRLNNDYSASAGTASPSRAQATKKTALGLTAFVAQQRGFYSEDIGHRDRWNPRRDRSPSRRRLGHIEHVAFGLRTGTSSFGWACAPSVQPPLAAGLSCSRRQGFP